MKAIPFVFLLVLLQPAVTGGAAGPVTVVAFGDSLTAGYGVPSEETYPRLLEAYLRREGHDSRVIAAGKNGETSGEAVTRLNTILRLKPHIVIVETGVNDLFRGIDTDTTEKNLRKIVRSLKGSGIEVLLAGFDFKRITSLDPDGRFTRLYRSLAADEDVALIPFFLEGVAGVESLNLRDRVHPNGAGYRVVADNVLRHLLPLVERVERRLLKTEP